MKIDKIHVKSFNMSEPLYFTPASKAHQKKEKAKARELRQSAWWKGRLGKGLCYHCEGKFKLADLTMDHLIPIVRGGKSDKKNCVPSCKECNTKKGYKTRAELAMEDLSPKNSAETEDN
jgi:5-methylcytosine-specific restriction protein A